MTPRGSTRVAAVIGDPIAHSRSPVIFNAAFAALDLYWVYVAFPVAAGQGGAAVGAMRTLGLAAMSVTMPHKTDAAHACDRLTAAAGALDTVNAIWWEGDMIVGDSTDGAGFLAAVADEGVAVVGQPVTVLGAGGAARAIVAALGGAGAEVTVVARRLDAALTAAVLAPGATVVALDDATALSAAVERARVVVNATPIGMAGERAPFPVELLRADALVYDTVYHPAPTPLVVAATARGVAAVNGLGMLVHQAAVAFEHFTGVRAPLGVMLGAARADTSA